MLSNNRQLKEAKVAEIKEKLAKAQGVVLSQYQGLNVEDDTLLRKNLREVGVEYKVYKNTLVILAAKELGIEGIETHLQGSISLAFGYEDPTVATRILAEFAKTHKKLELKAALIQGKIFDGAQVNMLASIPPRDVLIAKLLGSFKAPLSNFAYLLNAVKEQKELAE
ncbi:50S ribosomal protein L10 [Clostridium bowmanii]|uniref:50S ribosomal protein L10 n=1 Tax=Clostridium bowmanii TaxID=132925 RepID=UPI001C0DB80D|nr:50S ribosomal protein L10 [Clostridium bowmanii]MBU3188614.1 50S ribosomal protein L10 [Clostridium bowmanii]MCA1072998.1 50S ribosomal protein L10 [Clostridium bowmanii]